MRFHTFYTDNLLPQIIEDHKAVCNHLGIEVEYHNFPYEEDYEKLYSQHGNFMTSIVKEEEIACFLDIDCLPHHKENLVKTYEWVKETKFFAGNAQNISHTTLRNRIYAAASCLIIHNDCWRILGEPTLSCLKENNIQVDTAQILTLRADEIGMPYKLMYPIGYDGDGRETRKIFGDYGAGYDDDNYRSLGGYGNYGRGTLYPATYHWFRISQLKDYPDLWKTRVNNILDNQKIIPHYSSCFYGL